MTRRTICQTMPDEELILLWEVHRAVAAAFLLCAPTQALMDHCYRTLARHNIAVVPTA